MSRTALFLACSLLSLLACSAETPPGDAGASVDSGSLVDANVSDLDSATPHADSAADVDSSAPADAGAIDDAATVVDASSAQDAAVDIDAGPAPMCPSGMHVCPCATGFYCLFLGGACLAPTADCPPPTP